MAQVHTLDRVVIRFAGDSGDGMQLTGDRFTADSAVFGNDISTLPNFPAEIRAPAGTLPGVSSFQLHFANYDIMTPGDRPDVLVAMNPAALKANIADLARGGVIIADTADFTRRNLAKVGYETNPIEDGSLTDYQLHALDLTGMTVAAVKEFGLTRKDASRAKNMFALGLLSWLYSRPTEGTLNFLARKFAGKPAIRDANLTAFKTGYAFGETTETFAVTYQVAPAPMPAGKYRQISGNLALAFGLITAARKAGLPLFLGAYPITPASDVLHELSKHKRFGVTTFQAEDEIAGVGAALGASFAGHLGVTTTSGPGVALKAETIGLAVMTELPLVVCDIQRAGPSTGMPTKTEQADLLQVMYGRNGEAPVPVLAAQSPADCFDTAIEAVRIAITYRTPVILLSDGYIANGAEPWPVPDLSAVPAIDPDFAVDKNGADLKGHEVFYPYRRDPETLARPWAIPGTDGLQHRIGGLEKAKDTGAVSYDPANHDEMTRIRQAKVAGIVRDIPDISVDDPVDDPVEDPDQDQDGARVLVLGWGSTYGPIIAAVRRVRKTGRKIAQAHLRHLNPFPANLGEVLRRYDRVIVPEMNLGQLALLLRAEYLVDVHSYSRVRGLPISLSELAKDLESEIDSLEGGFGVTAVNGNTNGHGSSTGSGPSTGSGNGRSGLAGVPLAVQPLNRKDFTSDQEVRWCPGCGDYAVLAAFQGFMPELGIRKENTVIISGIGCSSRFPYYVDSFGMHSIHGRATAIATGVATAREDVAVFVITGDGDALSIGGNHLIHVLRRNVNVTILLFNNRIYGLTKGQYSPTSELGKVTKSTPLGSLDNPFNPVSLALGAEATFVARTIDSDRKHLTDVLRAAAAHRGTSFVEIYQNCPIYNDDAFAAMKEADTSADAIIPLRHGEPIRFGVDARLGVTRDPVSGEFAVVEVDQVGADALAVHDAHAEDPTFAFGLSRLTDAGVLHRAPIGIFRDVEAPTYDDLAREQVALAAGTGSDDDALQAMIAGSDTWTVR